MTPYEHPEYVALLAAVRATPDDDLPRLVLADWLEERGEWERAEFVRVQCELGRGADWRLQLGCKSGELLTRCGDRWANSTLTHTDDKWELKRARHPVAWWCRGFVHTVRGPLAALIGGECGWCRGRGELWNGGWENRTTPIVQPEEMQQCSRCRGTGRTPGVLRGLVRREPVRVIDPTDCEPLNNAGVGTYFGQRPGPADQWFWLRQTGRTRVEWELPDEVFNVLETSTFASDAAARAALSDALVAWAMTPEPSPAPGERPART